MRGILFPGLDSFRLLSKELQRAALWNVLLLIFQSCFEILSTMALLPLFYQLTISSREASGSALLNKFIDLSGLISWPNLAFLIVLIFLLKNLAGLWLAHYQNRFVKRVALTLTEELYRRFYQLEWIDFLQTHSAETARRIRITPAEFANNVVQGYLLVLADLFVCVLMMAVMAFLDYRIVLVVTALSIVLILSFVFIRRDIFSKANKAFLELTPQSSLLLSQGIDSFAEVKIYKKEEYFLSRFMEIRAIAADHLRKLKTLTTVPGRIFEVIGVLSLSSAIVYAKLIHSDPESLMLVLGLMSIAIYRIMPSLNRILVTWVQIRSYSYSVSELQNSFKKKQPTAVFEPGLVQFEHAVQIRNLSFRYPESNALLFQNLDLTFKKGDFLVMEGPSGAGKTTLMHLLAGLLTDYQGQIWVDKTILAPAAIRSWQNKLSFVSQAPVVLDDTILKNVAFGEESIDLVRVKQALEFALLDDFINEAPQKLNTRVGENGLTLSGGQRQRLVMARAFYREPEVFLLDEVTNQLDEENKFLLLSNLKKLAASNKAILLISHDPMVKSFATSVVHLENGLISQT